jgi:Mor family transcriptional regulator
LKLEKIEENYTYQDWERLIEQWVFNRQHRDILKSNLLDGEKMGDIAERYQCSEDKIKRIVYKNCNKIFKHIK